MQQLICNRCGKSAQVGRKIGDYCDTFFDEEKKGMFCRGTIIEFVEEDWKEKFRKWYNEMADKERPFSVDEDLIIAHIEGNILPVVQPKGLDTIKELLVANLTRNEQTIDDKYVVAGRKSYTKRELAEEIKNNTPFGLETVSNVINLTLDILSRDKTKQ